MQPSKLSRRSMRSSSATVCTCRRKARVGMTERASLRGDWRRRIKAPTGRTNSDPGTPPIQPLSGTHLYQALQPHGPRRLDQVVHVAVGQHRRNQQDGVGAARPCLEHLVRLQQRHRHGGGISQKAATQAGGAGGISPAPSWVPHWQAAHLDNELLAQQRALHARLTDERQVLKAALHGQAGASMRGTLVQSLRAAMGPTHKLAWRCQMHAPRVRVARSIAASSTAIAKRFRPASPGSISCLSARTGMPHRPPRMLAQSAVGGREAAPEQKGEAVSRSVQQRSGNTKQRHVRRCRRRGAAKPTQRLVCRAAANLALTGSKLGWMTPLLGDAFFTCKEQGAGPGQGRHADQHLSCQFSFCPRAHAKRSHHTALQTLHTCTATQAQPTQPHLCNQPWLAGARGRRLDSANKVARRRAALGGNHQRTQRHLLPAGSSEDKR